MDNFKHVAGIYRLCWPWLGDESIEDDEGLEGGDNGAGGVKAFKGLADGEGNLILLVSSNPGMLQSLIHVVSLLILRL